MGALKFGIALVVVLLVQFSAFAYAQGSKTTPKKSTWQTLSGSAPLVIAHGGLSGLFPDSSSPAYQLAMMTSVPDVVLYCDVQLTRDAAGICFPNIKLDNASAISAVFPNKDNTYDVNGVKTQGYFSIDFTLKQLLQVPLTQGIFSRSPDFDGVFPILTVEDVFSQNKPEGFWLNVQHNAFYSQHNLSMRSFVIGASKTVIISHISSPEVNFLQSLVKSFATTKTKLVFQFLDQGAIEPSTNQSYGSLLNNLTFIKTFASGILVPKNYILPVNPTLYLLPHTSLVEDAHKIGLEVFASNFANDFLISYNYSYNPVAEYLSFIDNGNFSVDGVLSDFPITPSEARDCFAHVGKSATVQAKPLVISHNGASGDYPGCTDVSYTQAILDGADVIDCNVQMSSDGVPFCLSSINLLNSTLVGQTQFRNLLQTVSEIQSSPGIFSFSMNWTDIQTLTPVISNPFADYLLVRNPLFRNAGKLISLSDFLALAKNATSLSGVLIKIKYAPYLAANQGLSVTNAVLDALDKGGYNSTTAKKVMIQSTDSSVLKAMKGKNYEYVYEVDETIRDALNATIAEIKTFADSVVVSTLSVLPQRTGFLTVLTDVVSDLKSFNLSVYVQLFTNEFVSIAYDLFSDPIAQLNSFVNQAPIDGVITDFPQTAVAYKKNRCLTMKNTPTYMSPVQPGQLLSLIAPSVLPPAAAPSPLLTVADVSEPPLPSVVVPNTTTNTTAPTPSAVKTPSSGHREITTSSLLSCLAMVMAAALLC